ncbi:MAG: hypothetical protein V4667_05565 [Bacteroidota bacterium]
MYKIILLSLLFCANLVAQNSFNIEQYYYKINKNVFLCDGIENTISDAERKKLIVTLDNKNGYIKAKPRVGDLQIALFKNKTLKKDFVLVNLTCGAGCMCNTLVFYEAIADGNLKPTSSLFPNDEIDKENQKWQKQLNTDELFTAIVLPQFGTLIKVINDDNGEHLYNLKWNGSAFLVQQK